MIKMGGLGTSITIYRHIAKEYKKPKKKRKARKYYKCDKTKHIARDCRTGQKMKNRSVQEESNNEESDKKTSFVKGSE